VAIVHASAGSGLTEAKLAATMRPTAGVVVSQAMIGF
jgi:hypothetical protein